MHIFICKEEYKMHAFVLRCRHCVLHNVRDNCIAGNPTEPHKNDKYTHICITQSHAFHHTAYVDVYRCFIMYAYIILYM